MKNGFRNIGTPDESSNTSIVHYSDVELEMEVARRKRLRDTMPKPRETVDLSGILKYAQETIRDIDMGKFDSDAYITMYGIVMEAVYGPDVWMWITEKRKED